MPAALLLAQLEVIHRKVVVPQNGGTANDFAR